MIDANRYLVQWRSSVTGRHTDSYTHRGRAEERLEEVREREHFEAGAVVDTADQGHSADEFTRKHRSFHQRITG